MSIEDGYSRFACDRSEQCHPDGKKPIEYLGEHDKRRNQWLTAEYTDVNDVKRQVTLCPLCAPTFEKIKNDYAEELNLFMNQ